MQRACLPFLGRRSCHQPSVPSVRSLFPEGPSVDGSGAEHHDRPPGLVARYLPSAAASPFLPQMIGAYSNLSAKIRTTRARKPRSPGSRVCSLAGSPDSSNRAASPWSKGPVPRAADTPAQAVRRPSGAQVQIRSLSPRVPLDRRLSTSHAARPIFSSTKPLPK